MISCLDKLISATEADNNEQLLNVFSAIKDDLLDQGMTLDTLTTLESVLVEDKDFKKNYSKSYNSFRQQIIKLDEYIKRTGL